MAMERKIESQATRVDIPEYALMFAMDDFA